MAVADIQTSLAGGELSPQLYARVDLEKYGVGAALIRNFTVNYTGGVDFRGGFRFIVECKDEPGAKRVMPFVVSTQASFLLEFGAFYVRIYTSGVFVQELVTPYAAADLFHLKTTQSADVMTIVHPSYPPANLSRTAPLVFAYAPLVTGPTISSPAFTAVGPAAAGTYSYGYLVSAVDSDGNEESLASPPGVAHSLILNETANDVVTLFWTPPAEAVSLYNIYKWGPVDENLPPSSVWGFIGTSRTPTFTDNNIAPDFARQPPNWGDPFSGGQFIDITVTAPGSGYNGSGVFPAIPYVPLSITGDGTNAAGYAVIDKTSGTIVGAYFTNPGKNYTTATITANGEGGTGATFSYDLTAITPLYPAATAYVQQRRAFGGADLTPETLVLSQIALYDNFNTTPVALDTDAIVASIPGEEINTIRSMVPVSYGLIIFTTGGTYLLNGGSPYAPITPASVSIQAQSFTGANYLQPLRVNSDVVYAQNQGNVVRNLSFAFQKQTFQGSDLSTLANHLFKGFSIVDWCWSENPDKLLWVVRDDGKLLSMTYVPDQEVFAWARHDTQGIVKSICSIPEGDSSAVYIVVERHLDLGDGSPCWKQYIERLSIRRNCCIYNARYLDSHVELNRAVQTDPIWLQPGVTASTVIVTSYDPCEVPPPPFGPFDFTTGYISSTDITPAAGINWQTQNNGGNVDQNGNLWIQPPFIANYFRSIAPDGTITSHDANTIVDLIRTYVTTNAPAGGWSPTGGGMEGLSVVSDGTTNKLIYVGWVYQGGLTFSDTIAVFDVDALGVLTVEGVAWSIPGKAVITSDPVINSVSLAQTQTFDDGVVAWMSGGEAPYNIWAKVYPSINSVIGHCGTFDSERYILDPNDIVGDMYYGFGTSSPGLGVNAGGTCRFAFCLPWSDAGTIKTNLMIYINKANMVTNHASGSPVLFTDAQWGSYPGGFMSTTDLGVVTGPAILSPTHVPTCTDIPTTPVVAGNVFSDAGMPYAAFSDVGEYYDGTTGGGSDRNDYFPVPSVLKLTSTTFRCAWYQPFFIDNTYTPLGSDYSILGRLRVQIYDTTTGLFTDDSIIQGPMALISEIGGGGGAVDPGAIDICEAVITWNGAQVLIWNINGPSATAACRNFAWLASFGGTAFSSGDVMQIDCGKIRIDTIVSPTELIGTIIAPLDLDLPNDPDGTLVPITSGGWTLTTPTDTIPNLDHLEGKEVWAIGDSTVYGPLTVSGGSVTLGAVVSSACVGLQYQGQIKTLYLDTEGLQPGSIQGKRKLIPATTLRVDCSRGLEVGTRFDHLTPVPDLAGTILFTGDARAVVFGEWNKPGEVCVEQNLPLPASVLGIIVEVTPGDTGR